MNKKEIIDWLDIHEVSGYEIHEDNSVSVFGDVNLATRKIDILPLQFENIYGDFNIYDNKLKSAKGFPRYVEGRLTLNNNQIDSFEGFPLQVDKDVYLSFNKIGSLRNLKTLIGGTLYCDNNPLETLEINTEIKGKIYYYNEKEINKLLLGFEQFYDDKGFLSIHAKNLQPVFLKNKLQDILPNQAHKKRTKI